MLLGDLLPALDLAMMAAQTLVVVAVLVLLVLMGAPLAALEAPGGLLVLITGLVRPMREAAALATAGLVMMAAAMARPLATEVRVPQIQAAVAVAVMLVSTRHGPTLPAEMEEVALYCCVTFDKGLRCFTLI
jgi:hypothetical protein